MSLKGQLTTKMHWLHFSLQEEKVTFVMSGMKKSAVKCQKVPGRTLQCYRCMDQWYHEDLWHYSASVCGCITDQAGDALWQLIPEQKWANGRWT